MKHGTDTPLTSRGRRTSWTATAAHTWTAAESGAAYALELAMTDKHYLHLTRNVWYVESGCLCYMVHPHYEYYKKIEELDSHFGKLNFIAQVAEKGWATDKVIADLVRAIHRVVRLR